MSKHTFRFNYSDRADFSQPLVDISTTGKETQFIRPRADLNASPATETILLIAAPN